MPQETTRACCRSLEPVVERELERHLKAAKEWFPHEYVPWSQGRDYDGVMEGVAWDVSQSHVSPVARTALVVNLLTEDNLPAYHREISNTFTRDGAWGTWVDRWTAEEGRHGIALRDYLLVTRAVDPVQARARAHAAHGRRLRAGPRGDAPLGRLRVLPGASRPASRTATPAGSPRTPTASSLLARIAQDENLHMVFYRNLLDAAFDLAPDQTLEAVRDVVSTFQMPGYTIEDFGRRSLQIAMNGIYDLRIHRDEVLAPVLRKWKVWDREGLSGRGEAAREEPRQPAAGPRPAGLAVRGQAGHLPGPPGGACPGLDLGRWGRERRLRPHDRPHHPRPGRRVRCTRWPTSGESGGAQAAGRAHADPGAARCLAGVGRGAGRLPGGGAAAHLPGGGGHRRGRQVPRLGQRAGDVRGAAACWSTPGCRCRSGCSWTGSGRRRSSRPARSPWRSGRPCWGCRTSSRSRSPVACSSVPATR
nr:acyl-ACP desaturase [Angustibacter aerolatus]